MIAYADPKNPRRVWPYSTHRPREYSMPIRITKAKKPAKKARKAKPCPHGQPNRPKCRECAKPPACRAGGRDETTGWLAKSRDASEVSGSVRGQIVKSKLDKLGTHPDSDGRGIEHARRKPRHVQRKRPEDAPACGAEHAETLARGI